MGSAVAATALLVVALGATVFAVLGHRAADRARREVSAIAEHDTLTGLPDRGRLDADVQAALDEGAGSRRRVAVVLVELNRFASVNRLHGPEVGDALLVAIAEKLRTLLDAGSQLYRYSGPGFAVLVPATSGPATAEALAKELQRAVATPFHADGNQLRVTGAVGWALSDGRAGRADVLLGDAALALQEASDRGDGALVPFDVSLRRKLRPATAERRLRAALEAGQFWTVYMPVVDMHDNRLVGVEALLRWADPEHGVINPALFLRALDQTGLILEVGNEAAREAVVQSKAWADRHPDLDLTTTINASPRQLSSDAFVDALCSALDETGLEPSRLCLEITEGSEMHDVEETWRRLRQLKNQGIQLALDNFGTGYSSLQYIRMFHLDVLKIERSFVHGLGNGRNDEAIVQQVIGLAHGLGMTPVAEGVDTEEQARILLSMSCDLGQGYYYSHPQPLDAIDRIIERGRIRPGESGRARIDWSGGGAAPDRTSAAGPA